MLPIILEYLVFSLLGVALICYYIMLDRLGQRGHPVKFLATGRYVSRTVREYRRAAREEKISLLPPTLFWVCAVAGLALGLSLFVIQRRAPDGNLSSTPGQTFDTLEIFASAALTFLSALFFSWRTSRKLTPDRRTNFDWVDLIRDPYLRNDFFAALLSWAGVIIMLVLGPRFFRG